MPERPVFEARLLGHSLTSVAVTVTPVLHHSGSVFRGITTRRCAGLSIRWFGNNGVTTGDYGL